ncbi:MAG TPA: GNAT family N-acetyltransferase [Planctomycetota bacterium]|nr:GNAT family N-acetyltransferase [Planctomycetota bacterium]
MPEDVTIRELKPDDVETLAEVAVAAWRPVYEVRRALVGDEIYEAVWPDALAHKAAQIRRACEPEHAAHVRVAETGGKVAGFVTFYADRRTGVGEIGNNAVHPDFQGRGIGRRMYAHVFDEMRAMGMRFVKVSTGGDDAHLPARRAYENAGFDRALPTVTYYRKL